jgi:hypothetical protein
MIAKRLGYLRTASMANSFRVGIPQHGVNQRPVHTALIHGGDRLLGGVRLLTMRRGRRALFPEMNLAINDQHPAYPSDFEELRQNMLIALFVSYRLARGPCPHPARDAAPREIRGMLSDSFQRNGTARLPAGAGDR